MVSVLCDKRIEAGTFEHGYGFLSVIEPKAVLNMFDSTTFMLFLIVPYITAGNQVFLNIYRGSGIYFFYLRHRYPVLAILFLISFTTTKAGQRNTPELNLGK